MDSEHLDQSNNGIKPVWLNVGWMSDSLMEHESSPALCISHCQKIYIAMTSIDRWTDLGPNEFSTSESWSLAPALYFLGE